MEAGDREARVVFEAMTYQISKEIASHGATLAGSVDVIVLTGGMANNALLVEEIHRRVAYLAPVEVVPGEREMLSLARAACAALRGDVTARSY
jgi:butyrate kinase